MTAPPSALAKPLCRVLPSERYAHPPPRQFFETLELPHRALASRGAGAQKGEYNIAAAHFEEAKNTEFMIKATKTAGTRQSTGDH